MAIKPIMSHAVKATTCFLPARLSHAFLRGARHWNTKGLRTSLLEMHVHTVNPDRPEFMHLNHVPWHVVTGLHGWKRPKIIHRMPIQIGFHRCIKPRVDRRFFSLIVNSESDCLFLFFFFFFFSNLKEDLKVTTRCNVTSFSDHFREKSTFSYNLVICVLSPIVRLVG